MVEEDVKGNRFHVDMEVLNMLRIMFMGMIADYTGVSVKVELDYAHFDFHFICHLYGRTVQTSDYCVLDHLAGEKSLFNLENLAREVVLIVGHAQRQVLLEAGKDDWEIIPRDSVEYHDDIIELKKENENLTFGLREAAEMAWKDEVIDTEMKYSLIGPDGEYASKEEWIADRIRSWCYPEDSDV